jgi:hypothetical protein
MRNIYTGVADLLLRTNNKKAVVEKSSSQEVWEHIQAHYAPQPCPVDLKLTNIEKQCIFQDLKARISSKEDATSIAMAVVSMIEEILLEKQNKANHLDEEEEVASSGVKPGGSFRRAQ